MHLRFCFSLVLLCLTAPALSQPGTPCDDSVELGECSIEVRPDGDDLLLVSSAPSCSVVAWRLDGVPRSTTVVDRGARVEDVSPALAATEIEQRVEIEQCVEVLDERVDQQCQAARERVQQLIDQQEGNTVIYRGTLEGGIRHSAIARHTRERLQRAFDALPDGCCITAESGTQVCTLLEHLEAGGSEFFSP